MPMKDLFATLSWSPRRLRPAQPVPPAAALATDSRVQRRTLSRDGHRFCEAFAAGLCGVAVPADAAIVVAEGLLAGRGAWLWVELDGRVVHELLLEREVAVRPEALRAVAAVAAVWRREQAQAGAAPSPSALS